MKRLETWWKAGSAQKKFALAIALFFACELLFMAFADFPTAGEAVVDASSEAVIQTSGVGWTGILPAWFLNLFGTEAINTAGVGWTGILPAWFINLFGAEPITTSGVGWTGILPTWFVNLFGAAPVTTSGVGWTGIVPIWIINLFG